MDEKNFKIFVVEDDDWYRRLLEYNLSLDPEFEVQTFADAKSCLAKLHERPDLITLDYRLPDMKGSEVLRRIQEFDAEIHVMIISEQDDIEVVVDLLKKGAGDYLVKSPDIQNRLLHTVHLLRKNKKLKTRIDVLEQEVVTKYAFQNAILGNSPAIKKVFELMEKASRSNLTVMITGETGTGKELVAKAIHYHSGRAKGPYVTVNMAAIPQELIESELFGHEKGAFTGAIQARKGKFEEADGGTLFLDEIGEMEIHLQAKLLRALQEREITRVGSNKVTKFDCRIVVATHRNLADAVKEGKFREDLYYRLFGVPIELPPLRQRGKDILLIAKKLVENFCKENQLDVLQLSKEAQEKLCAYRWPGNVRELKSVMELACVMSNGPEIQPEDLRFGTLDLVPNLLSETMTLRDYTHRILKTFLDNHDNDIPLVAEKLDISVATIYRMLKEMKGQDEKS
ncbi:MAG TPA: sigma-54 dependent transcriptional regulator [Bacteroidia bacterium]|nr:sigma-54 dependent transcriptional regulator [Bacteroidia bacterium]